MLNSNFRYLGLLSVLSVGLFAGCSSRPADSGTITGDVRMTPTQFGPDFRRNPAVAEASAPTGDIPMTPTQVGPDENTPPVYLGAASGGRSL